jgi:hypothetical protein
MWRKSLSVALMMAGVGALASCSSTSTPYFVAKPEPWRRDYEVSCLKSGAVQPSAFIAPGRPINGPSVCGAVQPFTMRAAMNGAISFKPAPQVQCQMVAAIERFTRDIISPAARYYYGMGVAEIKVLSSYSCRPRNGIAGGQLSEHGFANAIDIGSFKLVDGREISVLRGWRGAGQDQAFLRAVHKGGCQLFTTVLGPEANVYHRDHFHFDLAPRSRNGKGVCQ